ncbi:MAG: class I SAM-dependent methyltransferase [Chloroflexia bacterium]|nr:class I SAM-dependent methyltransferase [Chloroflexia bacterium]
MSSPFYDNFVARQIESGINHRIYSLYKRLLRYGLTKDMKILEIGCGIGVLTWLLSKKITQGYIEAVDFSQKSVDYATTNNRQPNVMFTCSDILQYEPQQTPFGYILAFDVLEHIPTEQHACPVRKNKQMDAPRV